MIKLYLYDNKLFFLNVDTNIVKCIYLTKRERAIMYSLMKTNYSYCNYKDLLKNIYLNLSMIVNDDNIKSYLPALSKSICILNKKLKGYIKIQNVCRKGYRLIWL